MDFAVIETGGKQYKITNQSDIKIEKINGASEGDVLVFDKVLLLKEGNGIEIGNPYIDNKTIEAKIVKNIKSKKIRIFRFKAKSRYRRRQGHRQHLTQVSFTATRKKITKKEKKTTKSATKK